MLLKLPGTEHTLKDLEIHCGLESHGMAELRQLLLLAHTPGPQMSSAGKQLETLAPLRI